MAHYYNYIDTETIENADKAFKEGRYNLSTLLYQSALYKIKQYEGDAMGAAHIGANLKIQLEKSRKKFYQTTGLESIESTAYILSKTTFIKGKQCKKQLYLNKFNRGAATPPDKLLLKLFKMGRDFESKFRTENFPEGQNIKDDLGNRIRHYASHTRNLFKSKDEITLFEAAFVFNDVLVLLDVASKNNDGTYDFYEVKANADLNKAILWDLAVQYYVCNQLFGEKINSFNVVLFNPKGKPIIKNLKKKVSRLEGEVKKDVKNFKEVLISGTTPKIEMGVQCDSFYKCEFIDYCSNDSKQKTNIL